MEKDTSDLSSFLRGGRRHGLRPCEYKRRLQAAALPPGGGCRAVGEAPSGRRGSPVPAARRGGSPAGQERPQPAGGAAPPPRRAPPRPADTRVRARRPASAGKAPGSGGARPCRPGDTRVRMPLSAAQGVGSSTGAPRHPRGHPRTGLRGATQTRRRICHESPPACAVRVRALVSVHRCRVLPCERDRRSVPLPPALRCPKHSVTENSTCCISKKLIIFMRSKMAGAKGSKSSPGGTSAVALPLCHIRTAKEEQVGPRRAPSRLLPTHQRACPHPKG